MAADPKEVRRRTAARSSRGRQAHAQKRDRRPRERHEQFELVQEALGIVTWIWEPQADLVRWYGDASRLLGMPSGRFSGRFADYLAQVHPEDLQKAKRTFVDCMKGRYSEYRAEERVIWPDGSVHWLETYGRAEYGADGRAIRMAGVVKDISAAKREESARVRAERLLAHVFDASPEYITVVRTRDGAFVAANAAFERVTGYRAGEILGRTVDDLKMWEDPAERDRFRADLRRSGAVYERPTKLRLRDGTVVSGMLSASLVEHEGERLTVSVVHDVSEAWQLQRRAQQSERMFASMFETSPVALVVSRAAPGRGADDRVVEINDAALSLIGAQREQAIGAAAGELVTWVEPLAIKELRRRALAGERIVGAPAHFDRRDGRRVEVLLSGVQLELGGEPHFLVALYDITERNRIARERENADASYRALFATAMDGIVILSPQWTFVDLNPAACDFMGYEREELLGRSVSTVFGAEELERDPIRPDRQWTVVERHLTRKDGTRRAIEVQAAPMPDGNILVIARDISERKRYEAMLMNVARGVSAEVGDAFFQSLVEHLARELEADFAFIAKLTYPDRDRLRTLAFVTDGKAAPNFEYDVAGSPCATGLERRGTVIYPAGVAAQFPRDAGLGRLGVEGYVGTSLHAADGGAIGVLVVMHRKPIERAQLWSSMIEIFGARAAAEIERARAERLVRRTNESLEQTVRERTAELEDANRDLESFNYSISHDLRQPLNAIAGFAELLRDAGTRRDRRQQFLREVERNAERMEGMIGALMQLARAGRGPLQRAEVDMRALVDSVLRELGASAPLEAIVEVGELPPARGDAVLLRQVWSNLLGNALKYSRGQVAPRVRVWGMHRGEDVEYAVSDNGVGFDMRHAERLFEAFQRLPSAASFEGSGVGLAIVQRIVRRHGGRLTPESAPGQGATFRFTLPA